MKDTLTIRLDTDQRRQLHLVAAALGQTDSEFVRGLIERGVAAESIGARLAHLRGVLGSGGGRSARGGAVGARKAACRDDWSRAIRERNWRD